MKKIISIAVLGLSLFLTACENSSPSNEAEESTETVETSTPAANMEAIDLSEYDLPATISIPDASKGKAEVIMTDWGSVEIRVGSRYGIELVPFGMSVADIKGELESDLVYEINFLEATDNLLFYEKQIKDSDIDPEYHFFYTAEMEGDIVEIKSLGEAYSKGAVEAMIASARSFEAK